MTKDTALTLALGCLEMVHTPLHQDKFDAAITAIREALAAPQGEPVAWKLLNRVYTSKGEAEYDWRNDPVLDNTGYCPEPLYLQPAPAPLPYNRDSVVVNLMRFANIDKHLAREIADKAFGSVTAPAPLSDEQILEIEHSSTSYAIATQDAVEFARAIERHVSGEK